jgi:hypothetical protein
MSNTPGPFGEERHTFGWALGTVRGLMSLLIVSFFWIVFLLPPERSFTAPLGHFFLITLVLMAMVTRPHQKLAYFPRLLRFLFVGGTLAVIAYMLATGQGQQLADRFTPSAGEIPQWPALAASMFIAFGVGHFMRLLLGSSNDFFQSARAWIGVVAMVLLLAETLFQFVIRPNLSEPPTPDALKVWESILVAAVSAYFGTRM